MINKTSPIYDLVQGSRETKRESIVNWSAHIKKLYKQIEEIKLDNSLSAAEKAQKIAIRTRIINEHKKSIIDAENYLGVRCATR